MLKLLARVVARVDGWTSCIPRRHGLMDGLVYTKDMRAVQFALIKMYGT
jgi:hypothetical protein